MIDLLRVTLIAKVKCRAARGVPSEGMRTAYGFARAGVCTARMHLLRLITSAACLYSVHTPSFTAALHRTPPPGQRRWEVHTGRRVPKSGGVVRSALAA